MPTRIRVTGFLCALVALSFSSITYAANTWETITPTGTTGYTYNAIASMGDSVYLATDHGVYRSTNRGTSWSQMSGYTGNASAVAIGFIYDGVSAYTAINATPVFVATPIGVYKSTLDGTSWTLANNGLTDTNIQDVQFDQLLSTQGIDTTVYAATASGVFRSDDSGATWVAVNNGIEGKSITKLTTDYMNGLIYALTSTNELFASSLFSFSGTDESWSLVYSGGLLHDTSMLNPLGGINWLGTDAGILKSDEFGANWSPVNSGINAIRINTVASDFYETNIAYAGSETGGVFRTTDEALGSPAWHSANPNQSDAAIRDIATNPSDTLIVFATGAQGVYRLELSDPYADIAAPLAVVDATAPVRSVGSPSGTLSAGTSGVTLALTTDESATCRYSAVANTTFASIGDVFSTTGGTAHSVLLSGFSNGTGYHYYVRCQDALGNTNTDDYQISFSIGSSGSSGGGGGSKTVYGCKDTKALNYSSKVTRDNGSCTYPVVPTLPAVTTQPPVPITALSVSTYTFTLPLTLGSEGREVLELQKVLLRLGYFTGTPTGYFGPVTQTALNKFQTAKGFEAVGSVGPQTRAALNAVSGGQVLAGAATRDDMVRAQIAQLLILIAELSKQLAALKAAGG